MEPNAKLLIFRSNARKARCVGSSWQHLTISGAAGGAASVAGRTSSRNCSVAPRERRQSRADPWRNTGRIISDADGSRIRPATGDCPIDKLDRAFISGSVNVRFRGQSGHRTDTTHRLLLTHFGSRAHKFAVTHSTADKTMC